MPAAVAMQPGAAGEAEQGGEVEAAEAEEEGQSPIHHTAWEAEKLRAPSGALGAKLQQEER